MYSLITDRLTLQQIIEQNDGEIPEEIQEIFNLNEENLQLKAGNLLDWREQLEAFIQMGKEKIKQAQEFIKKQERTKERIEESLLRAATVYGQIKVDTRIVSTRKSESVEIEDLEKIPGMFMDTKVIKTPDKNAIKYAYKSGIEVPGAKLVTKQNLSIK